MNNEDVQSLLRTDVSWRKFWRYRKRNPKWGVAYRRGGGGGAIGAHCKFFFLFLRVGSSERKHSLCLNSLGVIQLSAYCVEALGAHCRVGALRSFRRAAP